MPINPAPAQGYIANPIYNALVPAEGPKSVPVNFQFNIDGANTIYDVDFRDLVESGKITVVQTVFIDNSAGGSEVIVTVQGSNQQIKCPANSQGYFPVLSAKIARFAVTTAGSANVPAQFINVPLPTAVWGGLT